MSHLDHSVGAESDENTEGGPAAESVHTEIRDGMTYSCHPMTRAPRIRAGASSAAYMGTVAADWSA